MCVQTDGQTDRDMVRPLDFGKKERNGTDGQTDRETYMFTLWTTERINGRETKWVIVGKEQSCYIVSFDISN